ncbi:MULTISPECIES: hypothetical protein [Ralstonia]|jgi:hypothetical protein|uniref:Uncharacterized protein n=1 Tax=Ralstonia pickettii (strain 12D) TaxID=428406 RepID=C6BPQ0_RALP1|nr:hypothetical protein [Ralstonia pickettii]MCM3581822.1 hypothetical protein [Ralstonia pickettii]
MTTTKVADAVAIEVRIPAEMAEFAADSSYSPRMRVARVEQALKAWSVANETSSDAPDSPEGAEQAVLCLLSDLRHYCDAKGLAFAPIDRLAYQEYLSVLVESRQSANSGAARAISGVQVDRTH